ncbi:lipoate--protein ligase family protein [Saxibacter everestensis]|uniref:Lipoate--protein ligase family protein n=2 Tax=Saxibacter everestensis TaxID=2909229 RepID=A0ABY8R0J2_9MICO|nr:lipoate--protein ligase family protein [Brevibacteriaceae bacterium ZFBP1038]
MPAPLALGYARALLERAQSGALPGALRIYRPEPTVAFGQRDRFLPGFPAAVEAARSHGFEPVIRGLGGRAAAYHRGSLVVDHIEASQNAIAETQSRFAGFGDLIADALRSVGVDARVGEIDGEYCPGEYSINGGGRIKLVGTAQRIVSGAWLFSMAILVEDSAPIRVVLDEVYPRLGLPWKPETAGTAEDLTAGITVDAVKAAVVEAYRRDYAITTAHIDQGTRLLAERLAPAHGL